MSLKIDLHTHSTLSRDGGISLEEYKQALSDNRLDFIAITDHNEIDFAKEAHEEIGEQIIVAEEIKCLEGDIIGLYLTKKVEPFQSLEATIDQIKAQDGLVYIPHPNDPMRSGIKFKQIVPLLDQIDILETFNARYIWPFGNRKSMKFYLANDSKIANASGSDSHSYKELGYTFTVIDKEPDKENLVEVLSKSTQPNINRYVTVMNYLNPKKNVFTKKFRS